MRTYQSNRSDAIAALLNPTHGVRDEMLRKGRTPHNHAKDNKQYIRQLQERNRERKEAAETAAASTPRTASKYKNVSSRVGAQLERPASAPSVARAPLEPRNFMAGKPAWQANQVIAAGWDQPPPLSHLSPAEEQTMSRRSKVKPAVPKPDKSPRLASSVNFVQRNASQASLAPRRCAPSSPPEEKRKGHNQGEIPAYLLDRKMELAKAAADKEAAEARVGIPAGHHVLPEEERVRILGAVRENRERVLAELDALPFVKDTLRLRTKDDELVKELADLESAERAFSRKTVMVADDSGIPAGCASTPSLSAVASAASLPAC